LQSIIELCGLKPQAQQELIRLATRAASEAVRVAAIKEMFDCGFGPTPSEAALTSHPALSS
jgi:hypothetical protein